MQKSVTVSSCHVFFNVVLYNSSEFHGIPNNNNKIIWKHQYIYLSLLYLNNISTNFHQILNVLNLNFCQEYK